MQTFNRCVTGLEDLFITDIFYYCYDILKQLIDDTAKTFEHANNKLMLK